MDSFPSAIVRAESSDFYAYIESVGGAYGPSFRLIRRVVADEAHAVILLGTPQGNDRAHTRALLTDAAISTAHAIGMTPGMRASSRPLGLPLAVGRAAFFDVAAESYIARTVFRRGDADTVEFDIDVLTDDGQPALSLDGVRFQRLSLRPSDPRQRDAGAVIHDMVWQRHDGIAEASDGLIPALAPPMLIAAADAAEEGVVIRALGDAGYAARGVAAFRAGNVDGGGVCDSGVVLLAHSQSEWRFGDVEGPRSAVARIAEWIRDWCGIPGNSAVFVLVRGANRVLESDPPSDPIAAAVWAAAHSLASAPHRRSIVVVDADPRAHIERQIPAIARLVAAGIARSVALRDGTVYEQDFEPRLEVAERDRDGHDARLFGPGTSALITGGTGALGRWVAGWLVAEGVERIRLLARRASSAAARVEGLRQHVAVELADADVAEADQVVRAVGSASTSRSHPANRNGRPAPFNVVFHLAGDVGEARGALVNEGAIDRSFRPKLDGLLNLHRALSETPPARLVVFSSVAALQGSAGQATYAAANAAMAAAAQRLPGFSQVNVRIVWFGPWSGGGMADDSEVKTAMRAKGVAPMPPWIALRALGNILTSRRLTAVVALRADARNASLMEARESNGTATAVGRSSVAPALAALRAAVPARQALLLEDAIVKDIADIMELDPSRIDRAGNLYGARLRFADGHRAEEYRRAGLWDRNQPRAHDEDQHSHGDRPGALSAAPRRIGRIQRRHRSGRPKWFAHAREGAAAR